MKKQNVREVPRAKNWDGVFVGAVVVSLAAFAWWLSRRSARPQRQSGRLLLPVENSHVTMTSPAIPVSSEAPRVTFADIGGSAAAKESLRDVLEFLRNPQQWEAAGARLPRGVLLEGPPGCGKTLLARAVAGEAGVPMFVVSATEFVEMYVGVGAARMRQAFRQVREAAPAVLFIDELDTVGRRRGSGTSGGHDEHEHTLNQLLVCLDGFTPIDRIVILAATNRSDVLDSALMRPGRFDRRLRIPPLSTADRAEVLAIRCRGKKLSPTVSLTEVAERTPNATGADLESLVNEATLRALRRAPRLAPDAPPPIASDLLIEPEDFWSAIDAWRSPTSLFDAFDSLLIESQSQVAAPSIATSVSMTLRDGSTLTGRLLWADARYLKVQAANGTEIVLAKDQVTHFRRCRLGDEN